MLDSRFMACYNFSDGTAELLKLMLFSQIWERVEHVSLPVDIICVYCIFTCETILMKYTPCFYS